MASHRASAWPCPPNLGIARKPPPVSCPGSFLAIVQTRVRVVVRRGRPAGPCLARGRAFRGQCHDRAGQLGSHSADTGRAPRRTRRLRRTEWRLAYEAPFGPPGRNALAIRPPSSSEQVLSVSRRAASAKAPSDGRRAAQLTRGPKKLMARRSARASSRTPRSRHRLALRGSSPNTRRCRQR